MSFSRVHAGEWVAFACGVLILVGMSLSWYGNESAFASVGLLDVIIAAVAVAAILLPLVLARSAKTDLPIVYETLLSTFASIGALCLLVRWIFPPEAGIAVGFYLGLAGAALLAVAGWRGVAREN